MGNCSDSYLLLSSKQEIGQSLCYLAANKNYFLVFFLNEYKKSKNKKTKKNVRSDADANETSYHSKTFSLKDKKYSTPQPWLLFFPSLPVLRAGFGVRQFLSTFCGILWRERQKEFFRPAPPIYLWQTSPVIPSLFP